MGKLRLENGGSRSGDGRIGWVKEGRRDGWAGPRDVSSGREDDDEGEGESLGRPQTKGECSSVLGFGGKASVHRTWGQKASAMAV